MVEGGGGRWYLRAEILRSDCSLGPAGLTFDGGNIHHVAVAYGPGARYGRCENIRGPPSRGDTLIRRGIAAAPSRNPDNKKHGGHTVKESERLRISDSFFVNAFARN